MNKTEDLVFISLDAERVVWSFSGDFMPVDQVVAVPCRVCFWSKAVIFSLEEIDAAVFAGVAALSADGSVEAALPVGLALPLLQQKAFFEVVSVLVVVVSACSVPLAAGDDLFWPVFSLSDFDFADLLVFHAGVVVSVVLAVLPAG